MSNVIEELNEENRILHLQKKLENNIILEEELKKEDKEKLLELYRNQIENLKMNYEEKQKQFIKYKNKIIQLRK